MVFQKCSHTLIHLFCQNQGLNGIVHNLDRRRGILGLERRQLLRKLCHATMLVDSRVAGAGFVRLVWFSWALTIGDRVGLYRGRMLAALRTFIAGGDFPPLGQPAREC